MSIGVQAFAKDLGRVVPIRLHVDFHPVQRFTSQAELAWERQSTSSPVSVAPGRDPQQQADGGEDPLGNKNSSDLGTKHLTSG